ncbi:MAG TPA: MlaD family protein [Polyangia bacterium]|nr:MlaD family protein [Polyangia bacterium]
MSDDPDLPEAVVVPRSRLRPELVWAVPIVALVIGGWLAVKAIRAHGPTVTISFRDAGGLVAGKTKIKYRDLDVGEVRDVGFSPDRATVVITAELKPEAAAWMVDDTQFWVVRARVAAAEVSGLETVLSGAYIGLDVGTSKRPRRSFTGLEQVPVVSSGTPGRAFVARSPRAIGAGAPIFFHHMQVGQVTTSDLEADGRQVSIGMFVRAPFDRYVTTTTRFWEAGGIHASLDAAGVKVDVESLVTLVLGGISFEPGPGSQDATVAPAGHPFILFRSREDAMKLPDMESADYTLVFRESVRGLAVGAPVEFRGLPFGEVTRIGLDYDPATLEFATAVEIRIFPGRLRAHLRRGSLDARAESSEARVRRLVNHGLRAQIRTANLLTGQRFVAMDFFPAAAPVKPEERGDLREIPTVPEDDDLQGAVAAVTRKVKQLPVADVGPLLGDVRKVLGKTDTALADVDAAVAQFGPTSSRTADVDDLLQQVARAARSVRALADSLERHPESLIRGRP